MKTCVRCLTPYEWTKSSSNLRLSYCSATCEVADLGAPITDIERLDSFWHRKRLTDTSPVA